MERRTLKNTFDIRLVNHKVIAIILAVAMILSVFAGISGLVQTKADRATDSVENVATMESLINSHINQADTFDYFKYAGDLLTNGERGNKIRGLCNYETPGTGLANDLHDNLAFQAAYHIWRKPDSSEAVNIKNHYTSIIIKSISDYYAKDTFISTVNKSSIKHVIKFKKYLNDVVETSSEYSILKDIIKDNSEVSTWSESQTAAISKCVEDYVKQQRMTYLGPVLTGKTFARATKLLELCKNYNQFSEKVASYVALEEVQEETIDFLKDVKTKADRNRDDYDIFVESLDVVIAIAEGNEEEFFNQVSKEAYNLFGKPLIEKALKKLFTTAVTAFLSGGASLAISVAIDVIKVTESIEKAILNIGFSVDQKLDNYQIMRCLSDYEYAVREALKTDLAKINNSSGLEYENNIKKVFAGTDILFKMVDYDCDLYIKLIEICQSDWIEFSATQTQLNDAKREIEILREMVNSDYQTIAIPAGECNSSTAWVLTDEGSLLIYGYGEMPDYREKETPWYNLKADIHDISVATTIDTVGAHAFSGLTSLNSNIVLDKSYAYNTGCFDSIPDSTNLVFAETPHFYGNHEIKANIYSSEDISDDDYGNVYLSGNVFIRKNVSFISYWRYIVIRDGGHFSCQNMEDKGGTFLVQPGGYAEVRGDLTGGPVIRVNGTMVLKGNCLKFNNFYLESTSSFLQVFGDLGSPSREVTSATITNGVIELFGSVYGSYNAGGNSTTIIKGTQKQRFGSFSSANLRIENTSPEGLEFNNWATAEKTLSSSTPKMKNGRLLRLKGEIVGEEYYGDFRLDNGATIDHNLTVYGSVYGFPNGYSTGNVCEPGVTLYVKGDFDLTANGTYGGNDSTLIIPSGATVNVDGNTALSGNYYPNSNWMVQRVTLQIDGTLNVEGDFTTGTNGFASLKMENENAQLNVKGDYTGYREVQKNRVAAGEPSQIVADITAGTINIDGNVDKMLAKGNSTITVRGADISNSAFSERNVVRLSGSKEQALSGNELFSTLILQHNNGLIFSTKTKVGNLFNHNGYAFTVSDQENTVFVDYDGDGQLDNDDPFPTDPNNVRHYEETAHAFVLLESVEPTCTVDGYKKFKCSECGTIKTERVPKLGHSFAWADNIHIAPSCTEEGYTVETCSRCGETQRSNTLPATGHDFGDMISYDHVSNIYDENKRFVDSLAYTPNTVTANTIGSTAIGSSELLRAGWAVAPREIRLASDKLGAIEEYAVTLTRHPLSLTGVANVSSVFAYDDTTQRSPEESALPYTDSEGNLYSIDSGVLSLAMNREQAEQKGILNPDGTVNVLAAEAENLKLAYSAGIPGTYILLPNIEFQNALTGWNEPVSIFHYDGKGAAEPGVRHVNYCFYNETLSGTLETTIKLYDYSKQNQLVPSTSDMPSYIKHTCVDCGSVVKEDIQSDQKLKIKAVSLSLGNNLSMNFKVDKTILDDYSDLCIEIMRNGKVTKVSSYKVQGDDIVFSFDGIAPQTMNDNTSAVLYGATPSKLYRGESVSTSVKEYASKALELYNDNKYAKLRTLMVDLLNYGSTAQIYHNYQKASLANADLTEEQQAWASIQPLELENITNTEYQTVSNPIANWKSASLILDNAVAIRYKFECEDVSGMVVKVQYGDIEKVFDGTSFEESGTGEYSFKFSGLYAHQMRLPIYVTLYKDDKPVSNTLQYSVESYAAQVAEIMPKSSLNTLTDSMMRYGISAFEYGN